jgi:3-phosphoshikimate 1-carboxyvinyltransferase
VSRIEIDKSKKGLRGELRVPGDKSISHRAVILGSISRGRTDVRRFLRSEDCLRSVRAIQAMGISIEESDGGGLRIEGKGLSGLSEPSDVLDMGNSGTSARLLTGLLAGRPFFSVLTGDVSLRRRPMGRVVEPLRKMGARISGRSDGGLLPLAISPASLQGMEYRLPMASAQVKSALLLAGLQAEGETRLSEPAISRDHTERMLRYFGADLKQRGSSVALSGDQRLEGREVEVPGDISSAAFFIVAATIVPGSEILLRSVGVNPTRTGVLDALREMGADIEIHDPRELGGEPAADLRVRSSSLKGIRIGGEMIPRLIDEIPILAVAAAAAEGETVVRDASELRVKESDRVETVAASLRAMGVNVETTPDGFIIQGGSRLKGTVCRSFGDHRIAMSMAVAGLAAEGGTVIEDTDCIETSFPGFEALLRAVS